MKEVTPRFKVKVNEFEFSFTKNDADAADIIKTSPQHFNLLDGSRSITGIVEAEISEKYFTVVIDGEKFSVEIKNELDQMLEKMGFGLSVNKQIKEVKAPMPGLVLQIVVSEGQKVSEGEKILILGAMKMENSINMPVNATIKRVAVTEGQAVEKGQVLLELE